MNPSSGTKRPGYEKRCCMKASERASEIWSGFDMALTTLVLHSDESVNDQSQPVHSLHTALYLVWI
jgi:hypothetical protein